MNKNNHIIVLNGHRYNAKTGEKLSHARETARVPEAPHQKPVHKPAAQAESYKTTRKPTRQAASHVKAHSPGTARTLMRQGVKKPPASLKRHIRVQARLDSQIKQPDVIVPVRSHPTRYRTLNGRKVHLIHHFSPSLFTTVTTVVTTEPASRPLISNRPQPVVNHSAASRPTMQPAFAPKKPRTTAELLEYAVRYADSPQEPEEPVRRHRRASRKLARRRTHAMAH